MGLVREGLSKDNKTSETWTVSTAICQITRFRVIPTLPLSLLLEWWCRPVHQNNNHMFLGMFRVVVLVVDSPSEQIFGPNRVLVLFCSIYNSSFFNAASSCRKLFTLTGCSSFYNTSRWWTAEKTLRSLEWFNGKSRKWQLVSKHL